MIEDDLDKTLQCYDVEDETLGACVYSVLAEGNQLYFGSGRWCIINSRDLPAAGDDLRTRAEYIREQIEAVGREREEEVLRLCRGKVDLEQRGIRVVWKKAVYACSKVKGVILTMQGLAKWRAESASDIEREAVSEAFKGPIEALEAAIEGIELRGSGEQAGPARAWFNRPGGALDQFAKEEERRKEIRHARRLARIHAESKSNTPGGASITPTHQQGGAKISLDPSTLSVRVGKKSFEFRSRRGTPLQRAYDAVEIIVNASKPDKPAVRKDEILRKLNEKYNTKSGRWEDVFGSCPWIEGRQKRGCRPTKVKDALIVSGKPLATVQINPFLLT